MFGFRIQINISPEKETMRNFMIGALLVALIAVSGFYFYRENHISIEKPTISKTQ